MLTFLRKIRKSLIDSGSARKYVLYAIGEIALVVIGILIALQINNWNEYRKERDWEKTIMQDLRENLEINTEILNKSIQLIDDRNKSNQIVLNLFLKPIPYEDSLDTHFKIATLPATIGNVLSTTGYEAFKNAGFEIIRDEKVKKEIITLFEMKYQTLLEWRNYVNVQMDFDRYFDETHFVRYELGSKPRNYDALLRDDSVKSTYHHYLSLRNNSRAITAGCLKSTERALLMVEEAIATLNK